MNSTTLYISFRIKCFTFLLLLTLPVKAQKEAEEYNISPQLYTYYQHCKAHILQPIVISMADTLFQMAGEQNDARMQAVALTTQLDYHYHQTRLEDSVLHYTHKVKTFAKETKQPKYYYFSWANRLITHYLKAGKINIALYEAEMMLKEAQKEVDKAGLLYCYSVMSQIYTVKGFDKMVFEWKLKEIELTEKNKLDNYNIANAYNNIAGYYISKGDQKNALKVLEKAAATANSEIQKISTQLSYVAYYTAFGNPLKAQNLLKECQNTFKQNRKLIAYRKNLYVAEYKYYLQTEQYTKALEAVETLGKENRRLNENGMSSIQYRHKGELYKQMGNYSEAAKYLSMYINDADSAKVENEQRSSSEFATLLNVERLNTEKKVLMLQTLEKELSNKTMLITSLVIVLGMVFVFLYRENSLNRKLKTSEAELKVSNRELTQSRHELNLAKERAEDNSRMKITFIQSMSHEIRTPLNSIIGFSDVLSDMYRQELPETEEFVSIIKENSKNLLRLVTDVLSLSELDKYEQLPTDIQTNINEICELAEGASKIDNKKEIKIDFTPERSELEIYSNPERLAQLLTTLMENAVKFTSEGFVNLSYTVLDAKKELHIKITDTGVGIPQNKQEAVFERFYKVDPFTQGTGLGLSICRSVAEKMKGSLIIDPDYTEGCRFILILPLAYTQEKQEQPTIVSLE